MGKFAKFFKKLFKKKKKKKSSKQEQKNKLKNIVGVSAKNKSNNSNVKKEEKVKKQPKQRKNVSKNIPNGRTLQTRDEYFEGRKDYRKEGYENKGLYRGVVVVDSNRNDDLAVIQLTKSSKGMSVPGKKDSKFRPFVKTKDDDGNPIRVGPKFKENKPSKDLIPEAVQKIKKVSFKESGNAQENRDIVRDMKGRDKKNGHG